jgi:hypothetical protein
MLYYSNNGSRTFTVVVSAEEAKGSLAWWWSSFGDVAFAECVVFLTSSLHLSAIFPPGSKLRFNTTSSSYTRYAFYTAVGNTLEDTKLYETAGCIRMGRSYIAAMTVEQLKEELDRSIADMRGKEGKPIVAGETGPVGFGLIAKVIEVLSDLDRRLRNLEGTVRRL